MAVSDDDLIWLGCQSNAKPHHVTGEEVSPRMHLNRDQAGRLCILLQFFASHGHLPDVDVSALQQEIDDFREVLRQKDESS